MVNWFRLNFCFWFSSLLMCYCNIVCMYCKQYNSQKVHLLIVYILENNFLNCYISSSLLYNFCNVLKCVLHFLQYCKANRNSIFVWTVIKKILFFIYKLFLSVLVHIFILISSWYITGWIELMCKTIKFIKNVHKTLIQLLRVDCNSNIKMEFCNKFGLTMLLGLTFSEICWLKTYFWVIFHDPLPKLNEKIFILA